MHPQGVYILIFHTNSQGSSTIRTTESHDHCSSAGCERCVLHIQTDVIQYELNRTHPQAILAALIELNCPHEQYKWHIYEAILLSNHFNIITEHNQIKTRLETGLVQRLHASLILCCVRHPKPSCVQFKHI